MTFSRILLAGLLVTSIFATQGFAAPTDSTELEARDQYSSCINNCIQEYAEGPNRTQCYKKCDHMFGGNAARPGSAGSVSRKPGKRIRSLEEIVERDVESELERRDQYSSCINNCIQEYAEGPNRTQCYKKCDHMFGGNAARPGSAGSVSRKPNGKRIRSLEEIVERDVSELESRDQYSSCINNCIQEYAEGPNRTQCYKKCDHMFGGNAARPGSAGSVSRKPNGKRIRSLEEIVERDVSELESRDQYSSCINNCIQEYAEGPNRTQCYKKCDHMFGGNAARPGSAGSVSRKPTGKRIRSLDIEEVTAIVKREIELKRRDQYSSCINNCIQEYAEGPNRTQCYKKCDHMFGGNAARPGSAGSVSRKPNGKTGKRH